LGAPQPAAILTTRVDAAGNRAHLISPMAFEIMISSVQ
jgi:hypothetical protein